jgi:hypothetical protein
VQCRNHPDREARVVCQKMNVGYCQECLDNCESCTDPTGYCKFRSACMTWELCKKTVKQRLREEKESA